MTYLASILPWVWGAVFLGLYLRKIGTPRQEAKKSSTTALNQRGIPASY